MAWAAGVEFVHGPLEPATARLLEELLAGFYTSLVLAAVALGAWWALEDLLGLVEPLEPEPPGPWTWRDTAATVALLPLLVVAGWCGLHVSHNAGMTLYHGNGPGARGVLIHHPEFSYRAGPVRVPCRDHPAGHLASAQQLEALVVANRHRDHQDALGRGFPWCCYGPGNPRGGLELAPSSSRSSGGGPETP